MGNEALRFLKKWQSAWLEGRRGSRTNRTSFYDKLISNPVLSCCQKSPTFCMVKFRTSHGGMPTPFPQANGRGGGGGVGRVTSLFYVAVSGKSTTQQKLIVTRMQINHKVTDERSST